MVPFTKQWGASQRMYYLAKQLHNAGIEVTVIHASFGYNSFSEKPISWKSIPVQIVPYAIQKIQEGYQSSKSSKPEGREKFDIRRALFGALKNTFRSMYHFTERAIFNDFGRNGVIAYIWSLAAWRKMSQEIQSGNISDVIISGPYFSTFNLINRIKKRDRSVRVVLDYRDPWNNLPKGSSFYSKKMEFHYLKKADKIVTFSQEFANDLMSEYRLDSRKFLVVYNGYDEESWSNFRIDSENDSQTVSKITQRKMTISYIASSISIGDNFRNPSSLVSAFCSSQYSSCMSLNLVGVEDPDQFENLIPPHVSINLFARVTPIESLRIMSNSDILVILTTDSKPSLYTLTGKLFDYLRSGAFIVGITNDDQIAYARLIEKLGVGVVSSNSTEDIRKKIDQLHVRWKTGDLRLPASFDPRVYSRQAQNEKLVSWLVSS